MSIINRYQALSMNKKIILSIFIGAIIGFFFGERCKILEFVNSAFVGALQITIIPYLFFSLIRSIGSLNNKNAKAAAKYCGWILLLLWLISAIFAWFLPYCFPNIERATFFVPHMNDGSSPINLVDVFIPANPFHSLSEGYIPAVVLFCILMGVSLINAPDKSETLGLLDKIVVSLKLCNNYIMKIMPLGLMLISAYTFGVSSPSGAQEVLLYITASMAYNVIFTLLILPAMAIMFTQLTYSQIIRAASPALLLSFASGNSFMALPLAYEGLYALDKELAEKNNASPAVIEERRKHIDVFVPLAFIVPSSYKFLVIFFVMFGGWFFDVTITFANQLLLFLVGVPCLFGSNVLVVPFLLELANIPPQAFNIFFITSNILVFFNNANNTMFIVVIVLMWCAALNREWHFRPAKLLFYAPLSIILSLLCGLGIYLGFTHLINNNESKTAGILAADFMPIDRERNALVQTVIEKKTATLKNYPPRSANTDWLKQILKEGELRVGYVTNIPFSFENTRNKLVGFDMSMMYNLAESLDCKTIVFFPLNKKDLTAINSGVLDIVIGGITVSETRLEEYKMSIPYITLHIAVMAANNKKSEFPDWNTTLERLINDHSISIAVSSGSALVKPIQHLFPHHKTVILDHQTDFFTKHPADLLLISAEEGYSQRILHPQYSVMTSPTNNNEFPGAFPLPPNTNAEGWREFVDQWIESKKMNGYITSNYHYWVSGIGLVQKQPRWSVLSALEQRFK
ncbi:MAG: cation:dicarboxylase symporter family transporter [Negativicutes bacterium]|jgi:Na+/H+-dicarboxylate symporter/ABC-type amino acid transport substrate-binding protein